MRKTLKSRSGASLLFVMGVMLLLLAIGTSAMAAASVSRGAVLEKRALNQLHLLADSVQRTVGSQLRGDMSNVQADTIPENRKLVKFIYDEIAKDVMAKVFPEGETPLVSKASSNNTQPYPFSPHSPQAPQLTFSTTLDIDGLPVDFQQDNDTELPVTLTVLYEAGFIRYRGEIYKRGKEIEPIDVGDPPTYEDPEKVEDAIPQKIVITKCEVTVGFDAIMKDRNDSDGTQSLYTTATYTLPKVTYIGIPDSPVKEVTYTNDGSEIQAVNTKECEYKKMKVTDIDTDDPDGKQVSYEKS